jgi:antitoxin component YwqK of YwqJK toxin-antitoxin module
MKTSLLFLLSFVSIFTLNAQEKNQTCYKDTSIVDRNISRLDTSYIIRDQFRKGDWDIYYDFSMTKKMAEYHFDMNGNKTGHCIEWFENGKRKSEFDYTNSWFSAFPIGVLYYPNGKIKLERATEKDSLVETSYFEAGKVSRIRKWTKNGLLFSESQWCESGQLLVNYNPTSTIPLPVKKYYCSGKLKSEYNWYVYGYTGTYTEFHENGQISLKGQFQELPAGSTVFMARKTGDWIYYDKKGQVVKTEKWEAGKLVK